MSDRAMYFVIFKKTSDNFDNMWDLDLDLPVHFILSYKCA